VTNPVYKIETWTGETKDHTIGYGADIDALNIYFREAITSSVGVFSFAVPTVKGVPDPYYYGDIAIGDKVKIWMNYDSISGDPDFVGVVTKPNGRLSTAEGFVRQISGLSQGEILLRKQKKNRLWNGVEADDIIQELAEDLGIYDAAKIATDTTSETIEVQTERYMDVLKRVSDYYDAGGSVKKDFMVDWENELVWKARPWRTTGVETLKTGEHPHNILSYNVTRDVNAVKNNISVYGASFELPGLNHDGYCELTTDWTSDGAVSLNTDCKVGNYSIQGYDTDIAGASPMSVYLQRALSSFRCGWRHQRYLNFYWKYFHNSGVPEYDVVLALLAPDWSNRFSKDIGGYKNQNVWYHESQQLGSHGGWTSTGSPDWLDIQGFRLTHTNDNNVTSTVRVDELYFTGGHYYGTASSGSADRDLEVTHDRLASDSQCTQYAQTLLYQKSAIPIQIDMVVLGNPNVLVGDRLPITIPAEGISAQNYDVIEVGQLLDTRGYLTMVTMVNSENIRQPLATNQLALLIEARKQIQAVSRDEKAIF